MHMAQTQAKTQLTQVGTVIVPVSDQDQALEFYAGTLGFERRADFRFGDGERWVEVRPGAEGVRIALVSARDAQPAGGATGVIFGSADVEADHAALRERGVDVDDEVLREGAEVVYWGSAPLAGVPAMFRFRDPDANSFLVVQAQG
jgi:catechol 2,3-dioxygenase-like lactoylglutathione lyase family enzyme